MLRKITTVAVLALLAGGASAEFRTVAEAHELMLSDVRLPIYAGGTLGIRNCRTCDKGPMRVTPRTVWEVNGRAVELKEFRRLALLQRDRSRVDVTVIQHLESNTVTRVAISLPDAELAHDQDEDDE